MSLYSDVRDAAGIDPQRALIRIRTNFEPAGGSGARVYPPTYPATEGHSPYVLHDIIMDGETRHVVLLDSVPSEANRAEEALLRAAKESRISIPMIRIEHGSVVTLTSLEVPHRYADAYLRDTTLDGIAFDKSSIGAAIVASTPADASALYTYDPGSLVYGAWNSHRKGRQAKFPRVYSSEILGLDPQLGERRAGRMDPLNLQGAMSGTGDDWEYKLPGARKEKGAKLSEIGHGNIAPNPAHGGVTIESAVRSSTLSFAALDRVGFGDAPRDAAIAARTALAAYALMADRLAFGGGSVWLRSGCELVVTSETIEWVGRGSATSPITLGVDDAISLFEEATGQARQVGLSMNTEPVTLVPNSALAQAIDFSLTAGEPAEE